jgi:hypothetical protein
MKMENLHGSTEASLIAARIIEAAETDIVFIPRIVGRSLHILTTHFVDVIEKALAEQGITYGDHPLLRPFIDVHSRELTDFVLNGLALSHQFGVSTLERLRGDPDKLLRVDLWDSMSKHIGDAEQAFFRNGGGMQALILKIRETSLAPKPGVPDA